MNANVMPRDNDPGVDATAGEDGIWGTDDDTGIVGDLVQICVRIHSHTILLSGTTPTETV